MVLYRDDDVLVLNKPSGLPVVGTGTGTGNANAAASRARPRGTSATRASRTATAPPLTIVHRLDKDASGCVVLARRAVAARTLARSLAKPGKDGKDVADALARRPTLLLSVQSGEDMISYDHGSLKQVKATIAGDRTSDGW